MSLYAKCQKQATLIEIGAIKSQIFQINLLKIARPATGIIVATSFFFQYIRLPKRMSKRKRQSEEKEICMDWLR